jgi:glucose-1-phosphate thymidylyltransferase
LKEITKGAILAAGSGNRIQDLPYTRILPKPLLPILEKPILEYAISNMRSMGVRTVYVVVNEHGGLIRNYLRDGTDFGIAATYVVQRQPMGIAHAISILGPHINEPFVVFLGDDFTIAANLQDMVEVFFQKGALALQGIVNEPDRDTLSRTNCIIVDDEWRILDAIEKPTFPTSNWRGIGIYIFHNQAFEYIENTPTTLPRNEREITTALKRMADTRKVFGFPVQGTNVNVNNLKDLIRANELKLALARNDRTVSELRIP